ncbi:MAG: hypothetical protein ABGX83_03305 [Nitrospira sp.]|nr:hypothetical protein [Candidatus Manganitrophaceae bacterium]HIL34314.1 hypothetical protein [Candidatus Manganitrophaceae bacterium]
MKCKECGRELHSKTFACPSCDEAPPDSSATKMQELGNSLLALGCAIPFVVILVFVLIVLYGAFLS